MGDWGVQPFRTEAVWARVERMARDVEWRVRRAQESQARAKELLDRAAELAAAEGRLWRRTNGR